MEQSKGPVRVLQIMRGGNECGGIESFVMNYYRSIDRERVQFDFLVHFPEPGPYDDEIRTLGGKIYYFSARKDKNILRYVWRLIRFFRSHPEYQIIHGHMQGFAPLYFLIAKLCGVPVRISHSHMTDVEPTAGGRMLGMMIHLAKYPSNVHWACSKAAGEYMYGRTTDYQVIPNAISVRRFSYSGKIREEMRQKLGLSEKFVVGHVGRFCLQKNQGFLLQIFQKLQRLRPESILVLMGEGPLEAELRAEAKRLGIERSVLWTGYRMNVESYFQMMDVFALPSLYEGLPIVLVEAQARGLPCVVGKEITAEADLTGYVSFLPLDAPSALWAETIAAAGAIDAEASAAAVREKGYDIEEAAERLAQRYEALARGIPSWK